MEKGHNSVNKSARLNKMNIAKWAALVAAFFIIFLGSMGMYVEIYVKSIFKDPRFLTLPAGVIMAGVIISGLIYVSVGIYCFLQYLKLRAALPDDYIKIKKASWRMYIISIIFTFMGLLSLSFGVIIFGVGAYIFYQSYRVADKSLSSSS